VDATSWHPVWVDEQGRFVDIGKLAPGEHLRSADGTHPVVTEVAHYAQVRPVYDLTIDGVHTYHVVAGTADLLVHNCERAGLDFTDAERQKVYDANLEKNGGLLKCEYCGRQVERRSSERGVPGRPDDAQIDHKEPRALGGHGGAHNEAVACRACNRSKSTKTLGQWDGELREFLEP
jgi:hypothetical protein